MDESSVKTMQEPQSEKKKLKRQFFLSVIVIAFFLMLAGQLIGLFLMDFIAGILPNPSGAVLFLFQYLSFIGIDILVIVYCLLAEKPSYRSFFPQKQGGMRGNTLKNFAIGLLVGFLMNGACILIAWLHGDLDLSVGRFDFVYMICALVAVCIQSGAEELLTRGYMMGALRERYNVWVGVVVNSLFFGVLHLMNPGITVVSVLEIVLIGFALSLIVYYLDSLWMCIAIHTAWNYTQNILFGLPNSGIVSEKSFLHLEAAKGSIVYDAVFGVEGAVTSVIVTAVLAVCVYLYARKKNLPANP